MRRLVRGGRGARITAALIEWYGRARRDLPWRRTRDPYAIWVSETMLQQTRVAAAVPYYRSWMDRFPNVTALAAASEEDVLRAWEGLGYYSRAKRLHAGARRVVTHHGGRLPDTAEELRSLPGVGRYTAGAVASIAFGRAEPVVDGNVSRVLARAFALRGDPARAPLRTTLWQLAGALVPEGEARRFNEALMELGATVCTPADPECATCPIARSCTARRAGTVAELPETARRPRPERIRMAAAVVWRRGRVLLVRQPRAAQRWPGLWTFPTVEIRGRERPAAAARRAALEVVGLDASPTDHALTVKFSITRFAVTLEAYRCSSTRGSPVARDGRDLAWKRAPDLTALPMPRAHRLVAERAGRSDPRRR